MNLFKSNAIRLFSIFFTVVSLSSAAQADLLNLSQYPSANQTNKRAKVSGVVEIPIQISSSNGSVVIQVAQADGKGFYKTYQQLALVDMTKQKYTILLDTNQLLNGWANISVSNFGEGTYFTIKLQVMGSSQQLSGDPASIILTP